MMQPGVVGLARQALLARGLAMSEVKPLDDELGRRAGALLARAHTKDVIDAALALLAVDGDRIVTSDLTLSVIKRSSYDVRSGAWSEKGSVDYTFSSLLRNSMD